MRPDDFKEYMKIQRTAVQLFKWMSSERAGRDSGNEAIYEWTQKFAESYRNRFETIPPSLVAEINLSLGHGDPQRQDCFPLHQPLVIGAVLEDFADILKNSGGDFLNVQRDDWIEEMKGSAKDFYHMLDSVSAAIAEKLITKPDLNGVKCLDCRQESVKDLCFRILKAFLDILSDVKETNVPQQ
jgi:hypothetical protein